MRKYHTGLLKTNMSRLKKGQSLNCRHNKNVESEIRTLIVSDPLILQPVLLEDTKY